MRSNTCTVCHRPLKTPASIELGMGPICAAKNGVDMNSDDKDDELVILSQPIVFDVVLSRGEGGCHTNVPRSVIHHSPTGFEYGYGGSGPADLALNILNAYIPPRTDGHEPVKCFKGICSETAWRMHHVFKFGFLTMVPRDGCTIRKDAILEWLQANGAKIPTLN